jgi:hypothetical protein
MWQKSSCLPFLRQQALPDMSELKGAGLAGTSVNDSGSWTIFHDHIHRYSVLPHHRGSG